MGKLIIKDRPMIFQFLTKSFFTIALIVAFISNTANGQDNSQIEKWAKDNYQEWQRKAKSGDAESQFHIGTLYQDGIIVEQDHKQAFEWFSKAAKGGDAAALANLGAYYANGLVVTKNLEKAAKYYQRSADMGYSRGEFNLASAYFHGRGLKKNLTKALSLYELSANNGYAASQANLGKIFQHGVGVEKDYNLAFKWLSMGADQYNAEAQYSLAALYRQGQGTAKDVSKAVSLYEESANRGYAPAMYNMGVFYRDGIAPVKQDLNKGLGWFAKGADYGHASSQLAFGIMLYKGQGIAESKQEGLKWINRSAKQGYAPAIELMEVINETDTSSAREEATAPEDILLEIWTGKEAVLAYLEACPSKFPEFSEGTNQVKGRWLKKNKKSLKQVDRYMRTYLKRNEEELKKEGKNIESALNELRADLRNGISKKISDSAEEAKVYCADAEGLVSKISEGFLNQYKTHKKLLKKTYK